MKQKHLILIPFWVERVLKRNNLPNSESLNYSKLRDLLSLSDLSAFLKFQNCDKYSINTGENTALLSSWEQTCQADERVELDSTVVPLSLKEEAITYINENFNSSNKEPNVNPYKVIDLDREHYGVIIYPGFSEFLMTVSNRVSYIEEQLKLLHKYFELHEVSATPIFKEYLRSMRVML